MDVLLLADLSSSIDENTVAWVVVSSLVGVVIGASVKFAFEDLLRPKLGWRRETRQLVRKYTTPLLRSAEALERRINILVRNEQHEWFETDEYLRMSTLYIFGEYLGWVRIVERGFGFLPFESFRKGREFNKLLNGFFRALTSHAYFRDLDVNEVIQSQVPRFMLTAVGEAMAVSEQEKVIEFTDFVRRYGSDAQFRRWFRELEEFLRTCHPDRPYSWDRLILAGAHLRALICFLDPKASMVKRRQMVNLELLHNPQVVDQLRKKFPDLVSATHPA